MSRSTSPKVSVQFSRDSRVISHSEPNSPAPHTKHSPDNAYLALLRERQSSLDDRNIRPDANTDYNVHSDIDPSGQVHIQQSSHIPWNIARDNEENPEISFNQKYQRSALSDSIQRTLQKISNIKRRLSQGRSPLHQLLTHFSPISSRRNRCRRSK